MWTARRARHRLRVESPVRRFVILRSAEFIERPPRHRGIWPVVRQAANHAVARPAIRTIYIGVVIPAIPRLEEFLQAIVTDRQIGRNSDRGLFIVTALPNRKIRKAHNLRRLDTNFRNRCSLRWPRLHLIDER